MRRFFPIIVLIGLAVAAYVFRDPLLLVAVDTQQPRVVDAVLALGADPTARDKDGVSALMRAIDLGNEEIIDILIAGGAQYETIIINDGGGTASSSSPVAESLQRIEDRGLSGEKSGQATDPRLQGLTNIEAKQVRERRLAALEREWEAFLATSPDPEIQKARWEVIDRRRQEIEQEYDDAIRGDG
ncbi:MAG: hypothetical protein AAGD38_18630 [Acidobacteriota bacterium]